MNWIKTNEADASTLPPLDKAVLIVWLSDYNDGQVVQFGGRTMAEDSWVWGVLDGDSVTRDEEPLQFNTDDDYHVTHWAAIEWPE